MKARRWKNDDTDIKQLIANANKAKAVPSSEETPMLQYYTPPSSPTEESTTIRSKSAPSSLEGSPLVNELKGVLNVDREENVARK